MGNTARVITYWNCPVTKTTLLSAEGGESSLSCLSLLCM